MFGGFGIIVVLFLPYIFLSDKINVNLYLLLQMDVIIIVDYLLYYYLVHGGVRKFESLN
ncbi:hypothetical protein SDC9_175046 [bioreactor metagenome]|uniref:Uncharacterized protein n=1 Tax=bioreactor metagenome TaxID=1076179 RepID=A0A645GNY2_9ZZZZ